MQYIFSGRAWREGGCKGTHVPIKAGYTKVKHLGNRGKTKPRLGKTLVRHGGGVKGASLHATASHIPVCDERWLGLPEAMLQTMCAYV